PAPGSDTPAPGSEVVAPEGTDEDRVVVVVGAPEPEPVAPVAVASPEPQAVAPEPAAAAPVDASAPGLLTIGARQPAEVYIDGRYVRKVPLVRRELEPGVHLITIQALDGRKKVFEVTIVPGETLRHVWDFDRSEWRP